MKKTMRMLSLLLVLTMLTGLLTIGASAGSPDGEGGGAGGVDLTGMLSLSQYVFVSSQGENQDGVVSADCYGVYAKGGEGEASFVPTEFSGEISVYYDSELTEKAEDVTATVQDGKLTVSGVVTEGGNADYYLSTGEGSYATTIYVVTEEAEDNATLTLADGSTVDLTTYAPNMANGDYTATTEAIEGKSVYIGGNRTAVSLSDFTDSENFEGYEDAAAWYISSGITNSGSTPTTFGKDMYGFEYVMGLYRLFQVVNEEMTFAKGFVDASDYVAGMGSNDQFSDAVSATMQSGFWDGIYTQYTDTLLSGSTEENPSYLMTNIEGVTELGVQNPVTVEFAYVGMYNAFQSGWSQLNSDGEKLAEMLTLAVASAWDEDPATLNSAKISAVSLVLMQQEEAPAADAEMTKAEVVDLLYAASKYVTAKTVADADFAAQTGSSNSDMTTLYEKVYTAVSEAYALSGKTNYATGTGIALVDLGETLTLSNATFGNIGDGSVACANDTDPNTALDGAEAAMPDSAPTAEDGSYLGLVYNATFRNAYYREALGSGLAILGDTDVVMSSDNGTLVLDGSEGSMAGTAYVGFGASLKITNSVAYSASQHLTNNLYNGTIHYVDSAAIGSGRVFSSDFWGGYQVFEDSIATGGNVTDEPTTLIVKNSVYGNSMGGNGFASQYYENSILNVSTATFQNTTSLVTDTGALTLVNSVANVSADTLVKATKAEDVIVTLVDSTVNLDGSVLAATADIWAEGGMSGTGLNSKTVGELGFNSDVIIRFYGDTILYVTGDLTVDVAEGANVTICSANLTEDDITNTGKGTLTVVTDESYGTVDVYKPEEAPAPEESEPAAEVSFTDVSEDAWYASYVEAAAANGLVSGMGDGTFAPTANLTRAQAAVIIDRALELADAENVEKFADDTGIGAWSWASDAIYACKAAGIISGRDTGEFDPNANITRAEVAVMISKALELTAGETEKFADDTGIGAWSWASDAIYACKTAGIISGRDNGNFDANANITRAEMAKIAVTAFVDAAE